jgi:hypothetical protein
MFKMASSTKKLIAGCALLTTAIGSICLPTQENKTLRDFENAAIPLFLIAGCVFTQLGINETSEAKSRSYTL